MPPCDARLLLDGPGRRPADSSAAVPAEPDVAHIKATTRPKQIDLEMVSPGLAAVPHVKPFIFIEIATRSADASGQSPINGALNLG